MGSHSGTGFRVRVIVAALLAFSLLGPQEVQAISEPPGGAIFPTLCRRGDGWFTRDKACHFGFSFAGAAGVFFLGGAAGLSALQSTGASAAIIGLAGVWREVGTNDPVDPLTRQNLSRKDLAWDGLGIAAGLAAANLFRRRRRLPAAPNAPQA